MPQVDEPFHHDLPGQRAGERRVLARAEQRHREQHARHRRAEQRREQLIGVADLGDVLVPFAVEHRRRHDQDRGVDEEREHQRHRRVDRREPDRLALVLGQVAVFAGLHDRRVQVEVVRHHGRAEDADRDVEHVGVAQDLGARDEAERDAAQRRTGEPELDRERPGDQRDQRDDQRLDVAEAAVLQEQHDQHVEGGQADAPDQRQAEQQVEGDRRADDLRQIARRDRDLAQQPQDQDDRTGVAVAAGLGEIAPAGDAEPRRQRLQQDRHQVGDHDDAEEGVAVFRAAGEVGCPIPGVHVTDGHQVAGTRERQQFAPESGALRNRNGTVDFGEAEAARRQPPAAGW